MSTDDEMRQLVDRESIRDCLARVSRGMDRRDPDLIRSGYWPEAIDDQGVATNSVAELIDWVVPGDPTVVLTAHTLGQSLIELREDGAAVETHVLAYHRITIDDDDRDVLLGGRYLDRFERRDGRWRISHRQLITDWQGDLGTSADWSHGLLGMPFTSEHALGRAHGDHSQTFFTGGRSAR